jgi:hypothetical protein
LRTFFGAGDEEHFATRIRKDHGPHIATIGYQARELSKRALPYLQRFPYCGECGNGGRQRPGSFQSQYVGYVPIGGDHPWFIAVLERNKLNLQIPSAICQDIFVQTIQSTLLRDYRNGAIQRAGIQIVPPHSIRNDTADRTFPDPGRAIDGQHRDQICHRNQTIMKLFERLETFYADQRQRNC